ncbi:hypothetical protein NO2_1571, partial [Candidatus Termititenax persephonae]
ISMMQAQMKKVERIKALIRKMQKAKNDSRGKITAKMSGTPGAQITGAAEMVAGAESGAAEALMNELMNVASSNEAVEKKNNSAWTQIVSSATALASASINLGEKIKDLKDLKKADIKNGNKDATLGDKDSHFFAKGADGKIKGGGKFGEKLGALVKSAVGIKETGKDSSGDGTTIQGEGGAGGENSPPSGGENDANRLLPGVQNKDDITLQSLSSPGATTTADLLGGTFGAMGATTQFMGALFGGGMTEGGAGGYFKNLASSFGKMLGGLLKSAFLLAKGFAGVLNGDMANWGSWAKPPDSPQAGEATETPGKPPEEIELGTPTSTTTTETGEVDITSTREHTDPTTTLSASRGVDDRTYAVNEEFALNQQNIRITQNTSRKFTLENNVVDGAGLGVTYGNGGTADDTYDEERYAFANNCDELSGALSAVIGVASDQAQEFGGNATGVAVVTDARETDLRAELEKAKANGKDHIMVGATKVFLEKNQLVGININNGKQALIRGNTKATALSGNTLDMQENGKFAVGNVAVGTKLINEFTTNVDGNTLTFRQTATGGWEQQGTDGNWGTLSEGLSIKDGKLTRTSAATAGTAGAYQTGGSVRTETLTDAEVRNMSPEQLKTGNWKVTETTVGEASDVYKLQVEGLGDVQFKLDTAGNLVGATINGQDVTFDLDNNKVKV